MTTMDASTWERFGMLAEGLLAGTLLGHQWNSPPQTSSKDQQSLNDCFVARYRSKEMKETND